MTKYTFTLQAPERDTRTDLTSEQKEIVEATLNPEAELDACFKPMKWGFSGSILSFAGAGLTHAFNAPEPLTLGLVICGGLAGAAGCLSTFFKGFEVLAGASGTVALNTSGSNHQKTHAAAKFDRQANKLEKEGGDPKKVANMRQCAHNIRQERDKHNYPHLDLNNEVLHTDPIKVKQTDPLWEPTV